MDLEEFNLRMCLEYLSVLRRSLKLTHKMLLRIAEEDDICEIKNMVRDILALIEHMV